MQKQVDRVNQNSHDRADDVLESMHAIMHLYRSQQQRGLRDSPHDLANMEIKALGFFARRVRATQRDLVEHSGRDKAQVARLIAGLRERGLLDSEVDEADRRSTRLSLSAEGKAVYAALHSHDARLTETALGGMSEEERAALMGLLARVRRNLEPGPG